MKHVLLTAVLALLICWPALAQEYGVGANINAGQVDPANMNLDVDWPQDGGWGAWDSWGVNVTEHLWQGPTERDGLDIWSDMRLRWAPDTLYLFLNISRWDGYEYVFPEQNPWEGDHLLIGIDPTLEGDDAVDDSWAGWPMNAPNNGPYVLKISHSQGITLNWGFDQAPDPVAEGWVRGNVARFDDEWEGTVYKYFGVRLAIYVPGLDANSQIGFNIGGSFSAMGTASDNNNWFAWRPTQADYDEGRYPREPVAGHLQRYGDSYGTVTAFVPAVSEHYGTGAVLNVPYVAPDAITIDGSANEEAWENAAHLSMADGDFFWDGGYLDGYGAEPDIDVDARVLHTDGALLVHITFQHYDELYFIDEGAAWGGNTLIVAHDVIHEPGVSDRMIDGSWSGFAFNAPDSGPVAYFINVPQGVTLGWNPEVDPIAEGYVDAVVWADEENFVWGVEMKIYSEHFQSGNEIGFNIGGDTALEELIYTEAGEGDYAWFAWQTCDQDQVPEDPFVWCGPGGNIMHNTYGHGTARLLSGTYGTGAIVEVPYVAPGTITVDGNASEPVWDEAATLTMSNGDYAWDGGYLDGYGAEPDIEVVSRLLHTDGALLVHVTIQHYDELYWIEEGAAWGGNTLIVSHDVIHEPGVTDRMIDGSWSGFAFNAPDSGPVAYFMNLPQGVTLGWNPDIDPVQEGYVDAVVWADEENFIWGVEMAIYSDQFQRGREIGFNIGGSVALEELIYTEQGEGDYAWWAWQTCDQDEVPEDPFVWCGPGGNIMHNTYGHGTARLSPTQVSAEHPMPGVEVPAEYTLSQNFPNPFNPSTTIEYGVPHTGLVKLDVFNALGQRVATLIDGQRTAGSYTVRFDAAGLTSGVYFYRLQVDGNTVATRKMMLMK